MGVEIVSHWELPQLFKNSDGQTKLVPEITFVYRASLTFLLRFQSSVAASFSVFTSSVLKAGN